MRSGVRQWTTGKQNINEGALQRIIKELLDRILSNRCQKLTQVCVYGFVFPGW